MKVKEGQWVRTRYNTIGLVFDLYDWFGCDEREDDGSFDETSGYVVDVSYDPRLLLRTGDLIDWGNKVVEVFIEEEAQDLISYLDKITKIWTKNYSGNYILQWEAE